MTSIPTIDFSSYSEGTNADRKALALQADEICRTVGFLVLIGHGVAYDVTNRVWEASRDFFDLSLEDKQKSRSRDPDCPRGYFPSESEALAQSRGEVTPPDMKEMFSIGQETRPNEMPDGRSGSFFFGPNLWPVEPVGFRDAWLAYYRMMEDLGARIIGLFALALGLPEGFFEPMHTATISALRALNYPESIQPLRIGQQRAGTHSDYGSLTILKSDPNVGGLEVLLPGGSWVAAPHIPGSLIINIGDIMARWTNDRWISTPHRVVVAQSSLQTIVPRRQSLAFFYQPDWNAEIRCIPTCLPAHDKPTYPMVRSGAYLMDRFGDSIDLSQNPSSSESTET